MQIRHTIIGLALGAALALVPAAAGAQSSSINTYSPYSMYGLGDLSTMGNANNRSMGGGGVGYRSTHLTPYSVSMNYMNPASYSSMPRRAFIFNVGVEGENFYLKDRNTSSSYSTVNIRDIGVLFPLGKNIGFGVSVTPYSSVGYRLNEQIQNEIIQGTVGTVTKYYEGEGDLTQIKAGLGLQVFKNFSLGLEMIYYKGYIDRTQEIYFSNEFGQSGLTNTYASMDEDISRIFFGAGLQYNVISNMDRVLTLGATYRMGGKLKARSSRFIPDNPNTLFADTVFFSNNVSDFSMADVISVGAFYHTAKFSVGADYSFANWGAKNDQLTRSGVNSDMRYTNTNTFSAGGEYTPNRFDVRNFFNRLSYRAGLRYQENYMTFGGEKINDMAVTFGIGFPMKVTSLSRIDLGFEYGRRGKTAGNLVRVDYFKVSLGLSLFGEDYWFLKRKYD